MSLVGQIVLSVEVMNKVFGQSLTMNHLCRILAEDIRVFAYCDEEEVNDDFAASQLERIAFQLQQAPDDEITAFKQAVKDLEKEAVKRGDQEQAKQFKTMVKHLGLP